jgi:DNA-binding transcriptional MerR regulator
MAKDISIEDLKQHSGLSVRTLHYYLQLGLLPSPIKRGKYARYSQEHLDRLDLILILKEMRLPLKEIRSTLDSLTPDEIRHYRDKHKSVPLEIGAPKLTSDVTTSSIEHFKNIKNMKVVHENIQQIKKRKTQQPHASNNQPDQLNQERWQRITLTDGVELHIRESQDKETLNKIEHLRSVAQSLFSRKLKE